MSQQHVFSLCTLIFSVSFLQPDHCSISVVEWSEYERSSLLFFFLTTYVVVWCSFTDCWQCYRWFIYDQLTMKLVYELNLVVSILKELSHPNKTGSSQENQWAGPKSVPLPCLPNQHEVVKVAEQKNAKIASTESCILWSLQFAICAFTLNWFWKEKI